jgi:hypothetical protein
MPTWARPRGIKTFPNFSLTFRTFAITIAAATAMMTPFALISQWQNVLHEEVHFFSSMFTFLLIAVFVVLGEFYSDAMATGAMDGATLFKVGMSAAFASAAFFEVFWGPSSMSLATFVAFACLFFGKNT